MPVYGYGGGHGYAPTHGYGGGYPAYGCGYGYFRLGQYCDDNTKYSEYLEGAVVGRDITSKKQNSRLKMLCAAAISPLGRVHTTAYAQEGGPYSDNIAKLTRELGIQVGMGAPVFQPNTGSARDRIQVRPIRPRARPSTP